MLFHMFQCGFCFGSSGDCAPLHAAPIPRVLATLATVVRSTAGVALSYFVGAGRSDSAMRKKQDWRKSADLN
jgi:uncharacterized membrane protein YwaF